MALFRPDVSLHPAECSFPALQGLLITEDFQWAMWSATPDSPFKADAVQALARRAEKLGQFYFSCLPQHPAALPLPLLTDNPADPVPVPLLLSQLEGGRLILGVLSDARPEPET